MVDDLYNYAKFQYECGNYQEASEYLYIYKVLVSKRTAVFQQRACFVQFCSAFLQLLIVVHLPVITALYPCYISKRARGVERICVNSVRLSVSQILGFNEWQCLQSSIVGSGWQLKNMRLDHTI